MLLLLPLRAVESACLLCMVASSVYPYRLHLTKLLRITNPETGTDLG